MGNQVRREIATDRESGFSYVDVVIATMILMVGVLALGAAMTGAVVNSDESKLQLVAKQYATAASEAIFSARDVSKLGFAAAQNVGSGSGIFLTGEQPIKPGAGTDGIIGTADDTGTAVAGYKRTIVITNINDANNDGIDDTTGGGVSLRLITVTINYLSRGIPRSVEIKTIVGDYSSRQLSS